MGKTEITKTDISGWDKWKQAHNWILWLLALLYIPASIYWAFQNAGFGLSVCILGQERGRQMVNTIESAMNLVYRVFPYVIIFIGIPLFLFILIFPVLDYFRKKKEHNLEDTELTVGLRDINKKLDDLPGRIADAIEHAQNDKRS